MEINPKSPTSPPASRSGSQNYGKLTLWFLLWYHVPVFCASCACLSKKPTRNPNFQIQVVQTLAQEGMAIPPVPEDTCLALVEFPMRAVVFHAQVCMHGCMHVFFMWCMSSVSCANVLDCVCYVLRFSPRNQRIPFRHLSYLAWWVQHTLRFLFVFEMFADECM